MEAIIKKAEILIEALPYIQSLAGKTVVIKYGGNAMKNNELKDSVMDDITLLKFIGLNPIVVHGGGPDINAALAKFNIESQFIDGLRVTDEKTIEVAQMVLVGKTNKEIVSGLCKKGGKAIGLSGIDGFLIKCKQKQPPELGFVGDITEIDTNILSKLSNGEYIPVISPIGADENGLSYNINADTVASSIAQAMKAEKLMLLTDVDGVKDKNGDIIYEIRKHDIDTLISNGTISGGMIPKVRGCAEAIESGVSRVHIINGTIPHCILLEIFTNTGIGTMIRL